MRINTNVSSLTAQESAVATSKTLSTSLEKLSSGLRINKASDDASGLAIADKLRTQASSIASGIANGNSAVTLLQIADKSMAEQSNILDTIKSKLIQANTATTSTDGRESIRKDISKLLDQLDNIAKQTNYNGTTLLQSSRTSQAASSGLKFQVGESNSDTITNSAVQSNTIGLAGLQEKISVAKAGSKANELGFDKSQIVTQADTATAVTVTGAAAHATAISVGGKVGKIAAATGDTIKITNVSSADMEKLKALANGTDLIDNQDGTFVTGTGATVDFTDYAVNSITLTAGTAKAISFTANTTGDRFIVRNTDDTTGSKTTIDGGHANSTIGLTLDSLKTLNPGLLTVEAANTYQGVIDTSITNLNKYRGDIGSTQNQVESAVRNLSTQATNVKAAESIIRDVDYAAESANFNKQNIISQAGSYAISQANSVQQNVLKLLQ